MKNIDWISLALAFLSIILTVLAFVNPNARQLVMLGGLTGYVAVFLFLSIGELRNSAKINSNEIRSIKNEINNHREIAKLKAKVDFMMSSKKGEIDLKTIIGLILIFVLTYLVFLSLGVVHLPN